MDNSPLRKKEELLKKFRERERPDKLMKFADLGLEFEESTFDYFREIENGFCHYDENYSLDAEQIKWLIKRAKQAEKMEKFLHEMREHYEWIAKSDHPLIEASNPLAGIEDFLVDELEWGIDK